MKIPAGIQSGNRAPPGRPGRGRAPPVGPDGDLFVELKVDPDPRSTARGTTSTSGCASP
ncbi:hypothetical protein QJS66_03655 [Kocuria rhizophila]|nr:hypothetical protein QJS66_03655 [Kocuria rhizophila]